MENIYLTFNFLAPEDHQYVKYLWLDREDVWLPDSIHGTLALRFPNGYGVHINFGYMKHPPTAKHNYSAALIQWTGEQNWNVIIDHPLVPDMDLFYAVDDEIKEFVKQVMALGEKEIRSDKR